MIFNIYIYIYIWICIAQNLLYNVKLLFKVISHDLHQCHMPLWFPEVKMLQIMLLFINLHLFVYKYYDYSLNGMIWFVIILEFSALCVNHVKGLWSVVNQCSSKSSNGSSNFLVSTELWERRATEPSWLCELQSSGQPRTIYWPSASFCLPSCYLPAPEPLHPPPY